MPFPFYMGYAAAAVRQAGGEVSVVDSLAEELSEEEFFRRCKAAQPDIVVAETSAVSFQNDLRILGKIKELTGAKVVLAGPHASVLYSEILENYPFVDAVALGEYELSVAELSVRGEFGKGFAFRGDGGGVKALPRPLLKNLDELPLPAWDLFPIWEYNEPFCRGYPNFQLLSSRGCLFKCIFCLYPQTMEFGTFRAHSPRRTVTEMRLVLEKYHPKEIYFDDSTFTQNKERVREVCALIKQEGIKVDWSCMTHAGTVDRDLIFAMADAGCVGIKFGIESGSPEILRRIKKGLSLGHVKQVFRWCKEAGIQTHATYMFGLPGETRETMEKTLRFALELDADSSQFSIAIPYPGTEFYRMAEKNGWLVEHDWSKFDGNNYAVISYPELKAEEIMSFLRYAQQRWAVHLMTKPDKVMCLLRDACRVEGVAGVLRTIGRGISNLSGLMIRKLGA
jgi:radical SAM superfamily enzyme YgiQ (UPF0313 family)